MSDIGKGISGVGKSIMPFSVAIGGVGAAAAKTSINFVKLYESTNIVFERMLGGKEAANDLYISLLNIAKASTYSQETFLTCGKSLVGVGVSAENTTKYMQAITDAVAGFGGSAENIEEVTSAFQTISTRGKLSMLQVKSLANNGVNALKILGNQYGVSTEEMQKMISNGAIPAEEALDKLTDGIENGTDGVNGMTAAMSGMSAAMKGKTLTGAFDSLHSAIRTFSLSLMGMNPTLKESDPLYASNQKRIGQLTAALSTINQIIPMCQKLFQGFTNSIGQFLDKLIGSNAAWNDATAQWENVGGVLGNLKSKLETMDAGSLERIGNAILKVAAAGPALLVLGGTISKVGSIFTGLSKVVGLVSSPISLIAIAIMALVAVFGYLMATNEDFRNSIMSTFSELMQAIQPAIDVIKTSLQDMFSALLPAFQSIFLALAPVLSTIIQLIVELVAAIAPFITQLVTALLPVVTQIMSFVSELVSALLPPLSAIISVISAVLDVIMPIVQAIIDFCMIFLPVIITIITTIVKVIATIITVVESVIAAIIRIVTPIIDFVFGIVSSIFGFIAGVVGGICSVISTIVNVWSGIWNAIKDIVVGIMGWIGSFIGGIFDKIKNAWNGLTSFVSGVFDGIKTAVDTVVNAVKGVVNFVIDGINGAIGIINLIPGVNIGKIEHLWHGTNDWQGGFAYMNEGGRGELTYLPNGAQVIPHDISVQYAKESARANSNATVVAIDYDRIIDGIASIVTNAPHQTTLQIGNRTIADVITPTVDANLGMTTTRKARYGV